MLFLRHSRNNGIALRIRGILSADSDLPAFRAGGIYARKTPNVGVVHSSVDANKFRLEEKPDPIVLDLRSDSVSDGLA